MFDYIYEEKTIIHKRKQIFEELIKQSENIKNGNIINILPTDLELLFKLYDRIFLRNDFTNQYLGRFRFSLSKRMIKSSGLTLVPRNISSLRPEEVVIEFRFGINFFLQYDLTAANKFVSRIKTQNALEALQLVLEHEICHAIEFILYHQSSCKGKRFKTLAQNLFGHKSSYHELPTNQEIAKEQLGLSIGASVSFQFKGKQLEGFIHRIHKRATVMVKSSKGQYVDLQGNRYTKYYVPLNHLTVVEAKTLS